MEKEKQFPKNSNIVYPFLSRVLRTLYVEYLRDYRKSVNDSKDND